MALRLGFIDVKVIATNHGKQFSTDFSLLMQRVFHLVACVTCWDTFQVCDIACYVHLLHLVIGSIGKQVTITTGKPNMVSVALSNFGVTFLITLICK